MSTDQMPLTPYQYASLGRYTDDDPIIRLLELQPRVAGMDAIALRLETYKLQAAPPYECLSYCWGSADENKSVKCNGAALTITATLHTALSHLQSDVGGSVRLLWIDQIAINQRDDTEKSQQVGVMRMVYENARRTIAWLGEAENDSDATIEFLRSQQTRILEAKIFPLGLSIKDMNVESDERFKAFVKPSREQSSGIVRLLKRPWFRRVWVIQEVAVSRVVIVKCGIKEISLEALFPTFVFSWLVSEDLKFGRMNYMFDTLALASMRARVAFGKSQGQSTLLALPDLLKVSRRCGATDPRDKLFALYGITSSDIRAMGILPNYKISAADLFIKATFAMLKERNDIQLLEFPRASSITWPDLPSWVPDWSDTSDQETDLVNLAEVDDPHTDYALQWFRDESYHYSGTMNEQESYSETSAYSHKPSENDSELIDTSSVSSVDQPETVKSTDKDHDSEEQSLTSTKPVTEEKDFSATKFSIRLRITLTEDNLLGLAGHMIDKISDIGDVLVAPNFDSDAISSKMDDLINNYKGSKILPLLLYVYDQIVRGTVNYLKILATWEDMAFRNASEPYPTGEPRFRAYWKTLCIGYTQVGEAEAERLYHKWRRSHMAADIGRIPLFGSSLIAFIIILLLGYFELLDQGTFSNMTEPTLRRRLAKTSNGYLGLVPKGTMNGDIVALLQGGRVPFILRPAGGHWQLIGPCYIHGAMYGERWDEGSCTDIWLR